MSAQGGVRIRDSDLQHASSASPGAPAEGATRIPVRRAPRPLRQDASPPPLPLPLEEAAQLAADACAAPLGAVAVALSGEDAPLRVEARVGELPDTLARDAPLVRRALEARDLVATDGRDLPGAQFAAAAPVLGPQDELLAVLVVADVRKRVLTEAQSRALRAVARQVGAHLVARRAVDDLAKGHARLLDVVDGIDGIVWEAEPETLRFTFVSQQAEAILGYPTKQWREEPDFWANHLHDADRAWATEYCAQRTREGKDHELEYRMLAADGRLVWIQDKVFLERDASGRVTSLRGLMIDITERKQAERRAVAQHEVTTLLVEDASLESVAPRLLHAIGANLGWEFGALWSVAGADGELACAGTWRARGRDGVEPFERATRALKLRRGEGLPGRALASGRAECVEEAESDASFPRAPAAKASGLRVGFAFPILGRHGVLGVLEFFRREPQRPDDALLAFCDALGWQMGQYLERRAAEESLRVTNERRGAVLRASLDCIITIDERGDVTEWNPAAEQTFGWSRDEAVGTPLADLIVPPELREAHRAGLARAVASRQYSLLGRRLELPAVRKDGSRLTAEIALVHVPGTEPPHFTGFLRDISERRKLEDALRASEARYRTLVEASAQIVWTMPPDGLAADMPSWREYTGQSEEEARAWGWLEALHPDDRVPAEAAWRQSLHRREPLQAKFRLRRFDGAFRTMSVRLVPVREGDGSIREWVGTCTDIEEQVQAERELEESRHRFEQILDSVQDMVFCKAPDSTLTYVNEATCRHYDLPRERLVGIRDVERSPEAHTAGYVRADRTVFETGRPVEVLEEPNVRHDGETRLFHTIKSPILDKEGRVREIVGVSRDVTERKRVDENLRFQAALLEAQMEAMPVGLLVVSPGGDVFSFNRRFCDMWGLDERLVADGADGALVDAVRNQLVDPDTFLARIEQLYASPETIGRDELHLKDGRVLDRYGAPVRGEDGTYYGRIWTFRDVTDERATQRQLSTLLLQVEDHRRRLDALVASVPGVVWETRGRPGGSDYRIAFVSDHAQSMLGYGRDETRSYDFWRRVIHPDDRERVEREMAELFERGGAGSIELRWMTKDARMLDVVANIVVVKDERGEPVGMRGVTLDVSERRRALEAIRRSDERFHLLARATNDTVWDWDLSTDALWWNDNFYDMFGWEVSEVEAGVESWTTRIHPDDLERIEHGIRAAIEGNATTWSDEYRFRRKDGTYVDVLDRGFIARSPDGRAHRMIGSMMDVTERKRAEAALRESEERFRRAFDDASIGMLVTRPDGRFVEANRAFASMLGYRPEEITQLDFTALTHPDDVEASRQLVAGMLGGQRASGAIEKRYLHRDGHAVWAHVTTSLLRDATGAPLHFVTQVQDVTDRKQAEAELREVSRRLERILDCAGEGIYGVDENGVTTFMNAAALKATGLTAEEALGRKLHDVVHHSRPDGSRYPAAECPIYNAARGGSTAHRANELFFRKDGTSFPVEYVTTPLRDGDRVVGAVTVFKDVSDRTHAEAALRESEERYRLLAEHSRDMITRTLPDGTLLYVSPASSVLLGYEPEELVGRVARDLVHPDDLPAIAARRESVVEGHVAQTLTMRYRRKDGEYTWVEVLAQPIVDPETGRTAEVIATWRDVNERQRAEMALRESEERFRSLSTSSPVGIFMADKDGQATYTNPSVQAICGFTDDEARGYGWLSFVHPDDRERVGRSWQEYAQSGQPYHEEMRWQHKDGSVRWSFVRAAPVRNDRGVHVGHVGTVEDITDRRNVQQALEKERNLLTAILQRLPAGVIVAEAPSGRLVLANDEVNRVLGHEFIPAEGIEQYARYAGFHPDGRPYEVHEYPLARSLTTGELVVGEELHYRTGSGELRPLLVSTAPVRDASGTIVAGVATLIDITERRRTEQEVRESRERLDVALKAAALGAWDLDLATDTSVRSARHDEIFGYPAPQEEWGAQRFFGHIVEEHRDRVRAAFDEAARTGRLAFECRIRRADGALAWIDAQGIVLFENGAPRRMLGVVADVTERKTVEHELERRAADLAKLSEELRYQRDLTRTITDNAASALFMMDARGHPIFVNPAGLAMTGYASLDEISSRPLHESVHFKRPDGSPYPMEECPIDRANAQIVPLKDQREIFCRKDGTLFPVAFNVAPVTRGGKTLGAVLEVRDITEDQRAERELRERAEELAALAAALERSNRELDQFAYITSHDLKAPLRGIANLATWIEEDLGGVDSDTRKHLDLLRGRVHRMEALIDAILQYSRVGRVKVKPEPVRVGELLRETVDLVAPPPGFVVEVGPSMPELVAEKSRLQQVFLNLIANAIKHHHDPANGRVSVACEDAGDFWRFTVADNGPGISPRFHDKIFVIFQTLEARDKVEGTGVGLALVKKIVQTQGGQVEVESDEGRGAVFRFTWPKHHPGERGDLT